MSVILSSPVASDELLNAPRRYVEVLGQLLFCRITGAATLILSCHQFREMVLQVSCIKAFGEIGQRHGNGVFK